MVRRALEQLAIYQIDKDKEVVLLESLHHLYIGKTSEIIYIVKNKKLYGIVCMGEVLYGHRQNVEVIIRKSFMFLTGFNIVKASEIFWQYRNIHKIPVVNEKGELMGDYSRWDDLLFIERNRGRLMQKKAVRQALKPYDAVYVVEPVENTDQEYLLLLEYLMNFHIDYKEIKKEDIGNILLENAICIFFNEDEKRGMLCLYGIEPEYYDIYNFDIHKYDKLKNKERKIRLTTYSNILFQLSKENQLKQLNLVKPDDVTYERLDSKTSFLFSILEKQGIKNYSLCSFEKEFTEYGIRFINSMNARLKTMSDKINLPFSSVVDEEKFYGELYQTEGYRTGKAQKEISYAENVFEYKKDIVGEYFNAHDGRRVTCFQPEYYVGTIYLVGMCTVLGAFVEDQYTIASYLQKMLIEKGYMYRVENYASMIREDAALDKRLEEIKKLSSNDIIIYLSGVVRPIDICGSIEKIFERNNVPSEWVKDGFTHCNHKANEVIAVSMYELVKPVLVAENGINSKKEVQIDMQRIMKEYIQKTYLNQYFLNLGRQYSSTGAIVLNADPFNSGHRRLIEQAGRQVDFLFLFILDETVSMFSFEDRFKLVIEGTKDLKNIAIVPSGDFVFSKNNFRDYYTHSYSASTIINAEYDINIFSDFIAKSLHITHRFAGEGAQGRINKVYYEAMRKILPQKGIQFVEIPRLVIDGEKVCTKQIQKYLEDEEYDKAFSLVPESTKQYLTELLDLAE